MGRLTSIFLFLKGLWRCKTEQNPAKVLRNCPLLLWSLGRVEGLPQGKENVDSLPHHLIGQASLFLPEALAKGHRVLGCVESVSSAGAPQTGNGARDGTERPCKILIKKPLCVNGYYLCIDLTIQKL